MLGRTDSPFGIYFGDVTFFDLFFDYGVIENLLRGSRGHVEISVSDIGCNRPFGQIGSEKPKYGKIVRVAHLPEWLDNPMGKEVLGIRHFIICLAFRCRNCP